MNACNLCQNQEQCDQCDQFHDKFIPKEEIKEYFSRAYVSKDRGFNGQIYSFDNTDETLKSTHSIAIGASKYCPYCGETMYPIQRERTLDIIGYCCLCEGARAELQYEEELANLKKKHEKELDELKKKYSESLKFDSEKLLEIKQKRERELLSPLSHFSTINGNPVHRGDDLTW